MDIFMVYLWNVIIFMKRKNVKVPLIYLILIFKIFNYLMNFVFPISEFSILEFSFKLISQTIEIIYYFIYYNICELMYYINISILINQLIIIIIDI